MANILQRFFQRNRNKILGTEQAYPSVPERLNSERGINFTVYKATGGTVIETRTYDRVKDRTNSNLYVITDDKEFGVEISKIITVESLKL